jgi:hypothetical protein
MPWWLGGGGVNWPLWFNTWRKKRMEGLMVPNNRQSGADVLLCTYESNTAGFTSFLQEETSVRRVII